MVPVRRTSAPRPVMLAVAGEPGAGKTTLTAGLAAALGPERVGVVSADDGLGVEVIEQLALGRAVLGEPREFVIVEGVLPLHSRRVRACFDVSVYLDPPDDVRRTWGGCAPPNDPRASAAADIVVRFAPIVERGEDPIDPLSATLLLRPTIRHPDLVSLVDCLSDKAVHLKLVRDVDDRPVDALHVHAYAPGEVLEQVERAIWAELAAAGPTPAELGRVRGTGRSASLALTQLLLRYHLEWVAASYPV